MAPNDRPHYDNPRDDPDNWYPSNHGPPSYIGPSIWGKRPEELTPGQEMLHGFVGGYFTGLEWAIRGIPWVGVLVFGAVGIATWVPAGGIPADPGAGIPFLIGAALCVPWGLAWLPKYSPEEKAFRSQRRRMKWNPLCEVCGQVVDLTQVWVQESGDGRFSMGHRGCCEPFFAREKREAP